MRPSSTSKSGKPNKKRAGRPPKQASSSSGDGSSTNHVKSKRRRGCVEEDEEDDEEQTRENNNNTTPMQQPEPVNDRASIAQLQIPSCETLQLMFNGLVSSNAADTATTTTATTSPCNDCHIPSAKVTELILQTRHLPVWDAFTPYAAISCCSSCQTITIEFMRLGFRWRVIGKVLNQDQLPKTNASGDMVGAFDVLFSSPAMVMKESMSLRSFVPGSLSEIYGWFHDDLVQIKGKCEVEA